MFNTLEKDENARKSGKRTVFIVSDATAITAETLAHSVLTQFTDLQYDQVRIPFIDTPEKAVLAAQKINDAYIQTGVRPLVFSTFVDVNIHKTFTEKCQGFRIEFFRSFIKEIEQETGLKSAHSMGRSHVIKDEERYNRRIEAINYSLAHDDGQMNKGLNEADVILVGVSRSGKTPTSLFLAMQFGVKAANYPLIPEDFERGELPEDALSQSPKCCTTNAISSLGYRFLPNVCLKFATKDAPAAAMHRGKLPSRNRSSRKYDETRRYQRLNSTSRSIEEISATIMAELNLHNAHKID